MYDYNDQTEHIYDYAVFKKDGNKDESKDQKNIVLATSMNQYYGIEPKNHIEIDVDANPKTENVTAIQNPYYI